ncbi:polysaccharide biosynthesis protein [Candidatus Uabimicrobium amorphum]|uniref:Polysaccharide biosynthesis protein CapD n=1 Tax=Uabimicrobium amorphum TaxID=2596890 RepID=A0A5S9IHD2_UABAM|nr:nucleoside-diphosphate sugar epimerase/dehydratase [Candidatus Uabimicrobium amorphum]BBM81684.1 polysaccharide biosynthesis protein CapD [Candidatus Uabimicrobium amorphum]
MRNRHFFFFDILLLLATPFLALVLRLETFHLHETLFFVPLMVYTLCAVIVYLCSFYITGVYSRYWAEASIHEFLSSCIVIVMCSLVLIAITFASRIYFTQSTMYPFVYLKNLPLSVPFIHSILTLLAFLSVRFSLRSAQHVHAYKAASNGGRKTLLIGSCNIARTVMKNTLKTNHVYGFLDDNPKKRGMKIEGKPILGSIDSIASVVEKYHIEEVIICLPDLTGMVTQKIVTAVKKYKIEVKVVANAYKIVASNDFPAYEIRKINVEDLLQREAIVFDMAKVQEQIQGNTVLVTGAGGSIGSELCQQLLSLNPQKVILLGHGENSIFKIHKKLQKQTSVELIPVIADIRFPHKMVNILQQYSPNIVFHTAAHKHVPLMEDNPGEAIDNNILGSYNLLQACVQSDVEKFVLISTDKAVNPKSIMGATKRIAEFFVHWTARKYDRAYVCVRFGNILNSRGSVIQTFEQQITEGGPITVTHPDMERYFMTIPEAAQLVLQAFSLGKSGDIFILDMGNPIKILDLAKNLLALHGIGEDEIAINFVGIRKGEKLYEQLNYEKELCDKTTYPKILHVNNTTSPFTEAEEVIAKLKQLRDENQKESIVNFFRELIPEIEI